MSSASKEITIKLGFGLLLQFLPLNSIAEPLVNSTSRPIAEIIVNASPLSDSSTEFAGSTSVYQAESLSNQAQSSVADVIALTPNLSWSGGSSSPRFFQIRGIGELEQYEGAPNPSVGLIFDDLDLSGLGLPTTLFDIEQIEVLRGPQATKFGANGLAGVLSLRSTEPTPYDSANGMLSLGSDDLSSAGLAFGGAVFDSHELSFRASVASEQSDGFRENLFLNRDDTNERERSDARLQLRYRPSHLTKVDLGVTLANQRDGYDAFALNNAFTTQSDRPGKDYHDLLGTKLSIEHALSDAVNLESLSSFSASRLDYGFDGDWGNNPFWGVNAPYDYRSASSRDRDTFSQELRLASNEKESEAWVLGLFGQSLDETSQIDEFQDESRYDALSTDYSANSFAAFAAYEKPMTEMTALGATIRGEHRSTDYEDSNLSSFDPKFDMLGGSLYGKYLVDEKTQLYTTISRGFKGGGFNAGTRIPDDRTQYDPESLWNYEIGAKGSAFNDKLSYSISAFWMERFDQQIKLALQDNPEDPLSFSYLTENVGRGRNLGLELELSALLSESFELKLSAGLLETEITSVDDPTLTNLDGREQSSAPAWNYGLQARYLLNDYWFLSSSLTGQDSFYFDDSHDQQSDPYHLLGAEVGWEKDSLRISLWAKNLTNEKYAVRGFFFGNEPPDFPNTLYIQRGDPSSFGMTLSYKF